MQPGAMREEIEETLEEVEVLEHHFHNEQICFGKGGDNYLADGNLTPFEFISNASANTFGSEVQIYNGSYGSAYKFDLDKIFVTEFQRSDQTYLIEFWAGTTTFAAATRICSALYRVGASSAECVPLPAKSPRVRGDLKIWGRTKCTYAGASSIEVLFESHLYPHADEIP